MTDQEAIARALTGASGVQLARLLGIDVGTVYRWAGGAPMPPKKRQWLDRWNRSHADLQQALLFWADPRNFPKTPETV